MLNAIQKGIETFQNTQSTNSTTSTEAINVPSKIENVTNAKSNEELSKSSSDTKIDSQEKMEQLIKQLNSAIDPFKTSIKFGFDDNSKDFYVSVIEAKTNKMIRRFPAEEAQSLLPKMKEVVGILFDQKG